MRFKLIDPNLRADDRLFVPALADVVDSGLVTKFQVVDVNDQELIGEVADWRHIPDDHDDPTGFFDYRAGPRGGNREFFHLGSGLLAQPEIWEPVADEKGE